MAGTTYANLKEYLLKIEKSGYLDSVIKNSNNEVSILFGVIHTIKHLINFYTFIFRPNLPMNLIV